MATCAMRFRVAVALGAAFAQLLCQPHDGLIGKVNRIHQTLQPVERGKPQLLSGMRGYWSNKRRMYDMRCDARMGGVVRLVGG